MIILIIISSCYYQFLQLEMIPQVNHFGQFS